MNLQERMVITSAALLGQAAGDAFGVPVEFLSREEVRRIGLREMTGADSDVPVDSRWGSRIPRGSWSDDTSMTVASMASMIRNEGRIDYRDQLTQFVRWWDHGEYCCLAYPFGLGGNISDSLRRFRHGTPALECGGKGVMDNGNGALMRILPFSLYCVFRGLGEAETVTVTGNGSAITHGHEISRMCCFIWTEFLRAVSEGAGLDGAASHIEKLPYREWFTEETVGELAWITGGKIRMLRETDIKESGYVADTLYAALYSLLHADSYETSIRTAVNLGYDTDTTAAVTGTAAGILYGADGIPGSWLAALRRRDYLESVARDFAMIGWESGRAPEE